MPSPTLNLNQKYLESRARTHEWVFKYSQRNGIRIAQDEGRVILSFRSEHQKKSFLSNGHKFDPYFEFE